MPTLSLGRIVRLSLNWLAMIEKPPEPDPASRRRMPLSLFLAGAIGLFMLVSLGLVLWLTLGTARDNTLRLLSDKAALVLTLVEARTLQFLAPAEALTDEIGRRLRAGEIDPLDQDALVNALRYALAAAPQLNAAAFADVDGWLVVIFRTEDGGIGINRERWSDDPAIAAAMRGMIEDEAVEPGWGAPLYVEDAGTTLVYYARPTVIDGELAGSVIATTSVPSLSAFMATIATPGEIGTFILYGRDRVLAHAGLTRGGHATTPAAPLPTLAELGDPALATIWAEGWTERGLARFGVDVDAHFSSGDSGSYVYLYDNLESARDVPWLIGGYFRSEDIGREWQELNRATLLAGLLTLFSLFGAVLLARRLAGPATRIAATARAVSALELDHIRPLGASRIRELDDAERALDSMVGALRCFVRYLPRDLVDYVLRYPERDIGRPRRQPMTIMFTDISGFTRLAEALDPEAAGDLLNEHFADLEAAIRATGGVIDKYMGDGLLAFWGAPEALADHQRRALEAALGMARAVRARNAHAAFPLRLRVGIASGEILVGDLGAPTRTNYTVIGDPVNVAQRLLEMGHVVAPDHVTVIVTTAACLAEVRADARPATRSLGMHRVRGRDGPIELVEVLDRDVLGGATRDRDLLEARGDPDRPADPSADAADPSAGAGGAGGAAGR